MALTAKHKNPDCRRSVFAPRCRCFYLWREGKKQTNYQKQSIERKHLQRTANMKYTTLKEHHLYNKTFQRGARFSGKYLSVFVLRDYAAKRLKKENPEKKFYNRFGLSVTKRVGGAVQRSRAKRILRAGYRALEPELKTGFLIVISPRDSILSAKSTDVERELRRGFTKLDMFISQKPL